MSSQGHCSRRPLIRRPALLAEPAESHLPARLTPFHLQLAETNSTAVLTQVLCCIHKVHTHNVYIYPTAIVSYRSPLYLVFLVVITIASIAGL